MKAQNVFYDQQGDSYFKIDKNTGNTHRVHRNGSDLARFKPQYTGSNYQLRKSVEKSLSPPVLTKSKFQVKLEHKHTRRQNPKSQTKSVATLIPLDSRPMGFGKESRFLDNVNRNSQGFGQKLKQFSVLKQKLKNENHSPRHGFEGSVVKEEPLKGTINMLQRNLKKGVCSQKRVKQIKSTSALGMAEMPESLVLKNQLKRERQIFLKYNSQYLERNNEKQENEMRDRKKNLKILERLQLEKNEKFTNQVYN